MTLDSRDTSPIAPPIASPASSGQNTPPALIRLCLLGDLKVFTQDDVDITPGSKKACCALAYLALCTGMSANRKQLAGLLWSEQEEEKARSSLRQCVRQLKTSFGEALGASKSELVLLADRFTIALNQSLVAVDALEVSADELLEHDTRKQFLSRWQGEALQGLECGEPEFDAWVQMQRGALLQLSSQKLEQAMRRAESDPAQAAHIAQDILQFDSCHELAALKLMNHYLDAGDRLRAQRCYQKLESAMASQLDMQPGEAFAAVHQRMLAGSAENAAAPVAEVAASAPDKPPGRHDTLPSRWRQEYRSALLNKVSSFWIDGLLAQSLKLHRVIDLQLKQAADSVFQPWSAVLRRRELPAAKVHSSADIAQIFHQAHGSLLILGSPGAGKTTLLLQLASALIESARHDEREPVPVVFHLATWAESEGAIADWMVDELNKRYGVPPRLGKQVLEHDLVPLFDGLDELPIEQQPACITAINAFIEERVNPGLVVCCRQMDYERANVTLKLQDAYAIQPVSSKQQKALGHTEGLQGLEAVLQQDASLSELLATPLMLDIVGSILPDIGDKDRQNPDLFRMKIFSTYVDKMLDAEREQAGDQVAPHRAYSVEESKRYLSWLAAKMIDKRQGVFYLEWMQPDWLDDAVGRWWVSTGSILILGVMVGVILGVYSALEHGSISNFFIATGASVIASLWAASMGTGQQIRPGAKVKFSLHILKGNFWMRLLHALATAGLVGLTFGYLTNWAIGMVTGIPLGIIVFMIGVLDSHFASSSAAQYERPNAGMRRSMASFLKVGVASGLFFGISATLLGGLSAGIFVGLELGLIMGLLFGGHPVLQHLLLRFFLWRQGSAPRRYVHFADDCVNRILLYPVGGGYLFTHRLLMEYLAGLQQRQPER